MTPNSKKHLAKKQKPICKKAALLTRENKSQLEVLKTLLRTAEKNQKGLSRQVRELFSIQSSITRLQRECEASGQSPEKVHQLNLNLKRLLGKRTVDLGAVNGRLQQSQLELRTILTHAPVLVSYIDQHERYRLVNRQYEIVHHRSARQIIGRSVKEFLGAVQYAAIKPYIKTALGGGLVHYEKIFRTNTGMRIMDVRYIPDVDRKGMVQGFVALIIDITESRQTELALEEANHRMVAILDTAAEGIITITSDSIIESANAAAERMFGYERGVLIGCDVSILVPSPHRQAHKGYVENYLKSGKEKVIGIGRETFGVRKDGSPFPIFLSVSEVWMPGKRLFTGIIRDLSEQKRLEKEIAKAADEERRRIAQDIHDSLGAQLVATRLFCESLTLNLSEKRSPEAPKADHLTQLLTEAIDLARVISRGLHPVEACAEGLMHALNGLARRLQATQQVSCLFRCPKVVPIHDSLAANHLFRIAQESATNALKHGQASRIIITLLQDEEGITLTVEDNGKGLPEGFCAVNKGLGMRIMAYRAGLLNASLDVRSQPSKGSIVRCCVPNVQSHEDVTKVGLSTPTGLVVARAKR